MATATIELTKEEIAHRGKEIYYRDIQPQIAPGNEGRVVAIDVQTGAFEMADLATDSAAQLRIRVPDAIVFFMRVGYPTMARIL
ncbi:MAG: hypothetical protein HOP19_24570 [Acidobacteria bacterium]|nr:hypothetical protein [Acidobacteriota bacterium]